MGRSEIRLTPGANFYLT